MGSEHTVYIGPYITYEMPQKEEIEKWRTCLRKDCSGIRDIPEDMNFCPKCGCKIGELSRGSMGDAFDIYEDFLYPFEESLWHMGELPDEDKILMPNTHGCPGKSTFNDCDSGCYDIDKEASVKWFEKEYAEEIKALKESLDNVEVKYGVVSYAM